MVFVVAIGIGAVLGIRSSFRSTAVTAPGTQADVAQATGLLEVTLDGDAIPQDLAGILVFRKVYPTDQEISLRPRVRAAEHLRPLRRVRRAGHPAQVRGTGHAGRHDLG